MDSNPNTPGSSLDQPLSDASLVPSQISLPVTSPDLPIDPSSPSSEPAPVSNAIPISKSSFPAGLRTPGGDGALLQQMFHVIDNCDYLVDAERIICTAVLRIMPCRDNNNNDIMHRFLALPASDLKFIALIFRKGLLSARNFGLIASTPASTPSGSVRDDNDTISTGSKRSIGHELPSGPVKRSRLSGPGARVRAAPAITQILPSANIKELFRHLGFHRLLPAVSGVRVEKWARRGEQTANCTKRSHGYCAITGRTKPMPLATAHLLPHSLAAIKTMADTPFWSFLTIILGASLTDFIYDIAGGRKSFGTMNGLIMETWVHGLFDKGLIWLIPHVTDFDPLTTRQYDVEFKWRGDAETLDTFLTMLPESSDEQLATDGTPYHVPGGRPISIGDRFRLFTTDPALYPLPHPLLLSLHALLWEMISQAGLADTVQAKQERLNSDAGHEPRRSASTRVGKSSEKAPSPTNAQPPAAPTPPFALPPPPPPKDVLMASQIHHARLSLDSGYISSGRPASTAKQAARTPLADTHTAAGSDTETDREAQYDTFLAAEFRAFHLRLQNAGDYASDSDDEEEERGGACAACAADWEVQDEYGGECAWADIVRRLVGVA